MKSKWLSALTWVVIGTAAVAGKVALADTHPAGQPGFSHCSDWSFTDSDCPAYLKVPVGKAAMGEPTERARLAEVALNYCTDMDWSFNDRSCPNYIAVPTGRPAFGEPTGRERLGEVPLKYCTDMDWSFNDRSCPNYIRR